MATIPGTQPYPWPFDGRLAGAGIALLLAGWDGRWRRRVAAAEADAADGACAELADGVLGVGGAVVTVAHAGGSALPPPALGIGAAVGAAGVDAFFGGPLEHVLRGLGDPHLLVAGHGLEGPVHSSLRSANDRGYECLLVVDATSSLTDDCRDASSSMVCMSGGIFGAVGTTADVLAALAALAALTDPSLASNSTSGGSS